MSQHHTETITCRGCGTDSAFTVWDSINTMLDPDMKEKVRTGEAFLWECPSCGERHLIEYATLYHQMEDHLMIWLVPGDPARAVEYFETVRRGGDPAVTAAADYRFRVVTTLPRLREKLLLLDEGLDDRVVELMKPFAILAMQARGAKIDVDEIYFDKAGDGQLRFSLRLADGRRGWVPFERGLYDHVAASHADALAKDDAALIDFSWAWTLLDEKRREEENDG